MIENNVKFSRDSFILLIVRDEIFWHLLVLMCCNMKQHAKVVIIT